MPSDSSTAIERLIDQLQPVVTMERDGLVVIALLEAVESPAVGEGSDIRFGSDRITGAALVREGRVVHAEAHRIHG